MSQGALEDFVDGEDTIDEAQEEALLKSDEDEAMGDSDDSDSDKNDEEEETRWIKEYIEILGLINQNKYGYDNYVLLIEMAHKLSDLEKIRQSYELFSSVYPIAPELWLKWLKIEANLATSPEEINEVEGLFRKALNDYFCPQVALEFGNFASKSPNADQIWSELLNVCALHTMEGRKIFSLWKNYFNDTYNPEVLPDKRNIFISTYKNILTIPMYDMEETYIEFKIFYEKTKMEVPMKWDRIDEKYNRAKDHLNRMLPFEKKLSEMDSKFYQNRATLYKEYIKEADRYVDENVLQILHERMVTDCCLNPSCWLDYVTYVEKRDKYGRPKELEDFPLFQQTSMDVVNRALRNCAWSESLFIKKMRLAEKSDASKEDVKKVLEQALAAGFQTPEPIVALWLEYLSYLRRNTNFDDENEVDLLRSNFNYAWSSLGKQWYVLADCDCEILQFWGRLEYGPLKDVAKGKELWTTVMESSDNGTKSGLWIEFAHLEQTKGVDATRKIYRKALNSNNIDNPYVIASSWLRFERCNGTADQIASCQEQCNTLLYNYVQHKQQQAAEHSNKSKADLKYKTKGNKRKADEISIISHTTKSHLKTSSTHTETIENIKKTKIDHRRKSETILSENSEIDTSKDHLRIFLSNLDYNVTEEEVVVAFPELEIANVNLIKTANGKGRGFGYVELTTEEEVKKALGFDRRKLNDRPIYVSSVLRDKEQRTKFKYSVENEKNSKIKSCALK